jgi:hypothetical protein
MMNKFNYYVKTIVGTLRRSQVNRGVNIVTDEYEESWKIYGEYLDRCKNLKEWMHIPEFEDTPGFYNVDGELFYGEFNSQDFYRSTLIQAIKTHFPSAKSFTEYGCGVGRNLISIKTHIPEAFCNGYELCHNGVNVAKKAAVKFNLDINYSQLDYIVDGREKYIFPESDVSFTMFSLEQLPFQSEQALKNILSNSKLGSIHFEPVPENYPKSLRGVLGRIEHKKVDYLGGFNDAILSIPNITISLEKIKSAHNPLMFPSAYIIKK